VSFTAAVGRHQDQGWVLVLNVGFIGAGRIATLHALRYATDGRARLSAVADVNLETARAQGAAWDVEEANIFEDYRQILDMKHIDAVEILLPHHLHHRVTLEAIEAGKHVSLQKPIAGTVAEAEEMVTAAEAAGVALKIYENMIFYPPIRLAKSLVDNGEIGDLISIRHKTFVGRSQTAWEVPMSAREWRTDRSLACGGQWLTDDGHHAYSVAWYFMGVPELVTAFTGSTMFHGGVTDSPTMVAYRFPGNRIGVWEATVSPRMEIDTDHYAADDVVELTGTDGVIWVTRCMGRMLGQPPVVLYKNGAFRRFTDVAAGWEQSFIAATGNFIDAITEGASPSLAGREGIDVLRWCLSAEADAERHRGDLI
jgi:predicted dehydrogenase